MAGHSKYKTIKHRKEANDNKKALVYTKALGWIRSALDFGGPDIKHNSKLRTAIDQAKALGTPKENIERTVEKYKNKQQNGIERIYEGYGQKGAAFIFVCTTDNPNRTSAEIKNFFSSIEGNMCSSSHLFQHLGFVTVEEMNYEEALEFSCNIEGVIDIEGTEQTESIVLVCEPKAVKNITNSLIHKTFESETLFQPIEVMEIEDEYLKKVTKYLKKLFENSQNLDCVYSNISGLEFIEEM